MMLLNKSFVTFIFTVVCAFMQLTMHLAAGLVTARVLQRGEQQIYLFGDNHGTHEQFPNVNEAGMVKAFYEALAQTHEPVMLLLECPWAAHSGHFATLPGTLKLCSKSFLGLAGEVFYKIQTGDLQQLQHVTVNTIDFRCDEVIVRAICELQKKILAEYGGILLQKALRDFGNSMAQIMGSVVEQVPAVSIPLTDNFEFLKEMQDCIRVDLEHDALLDILQKPINIMHELLVNAVDEHTVEIFQTIKQKLIARKKLFLQTLVVYSQLPQEVVLKLSIKDLCRRSFFLNESLYDSTTREDLKQYIQTAYVQFSKILNLLADFDLETFYSLETLEAVALQYITTTSQHRKVVVVAGENHTSHLARLLQRCGYVETASIGSGQSEESRRMHDLQISSLLQRTGDQLYSSDEVIASCGLEFATHLGAHVCYEQVKALGEKFPQEQSHLVNYIPLECFDWISQDHAPSPSCKITACDLDEAPAGRARLHEDIAGGDNDEHSAAKRQRVE